MGKRITPYFVATIVNTGDSIYPDYEGCIEKFYIAIDSELPNVIEFQEDGRHCKTFWTYEEAEEWLNENL